MLSSPFLFLFFLDLLTGTLAAADFLCEGVRGLFVNILFLVPATWASSSPTLVKAYKRQKTPSVLRTGPCFVDINILVVQLNEIINVTWLVVCTNVRGTVPFFFLMTLH